jgi:acetaldehyde dehydrogenase / alcohol dehydrogenase
MEQEDYNIINNVMNQSLQAAAIFSQLEDDTINRIIYSVYEAGFNNRVMLAKMALEETGMGKWQDKVMKNVVATQLVYEDIRNQKTCGIISEDEEKGIIEIAQPLGPIFAIIPVTNPTSTTLFKILICLKSRNPIIISPPRMASRCTIETAKICYEAALKADAPEYCIQWIQGGNREQTNALMTHKNMALILATGGGSLVHAAYSSGTPALGVGAGNVPVFIEKSADFKDAVQKIILSKTFDNGTVCASEQAIVVEKSYSDKVVHEFENQNCYFLAPDEIKKIEVLAFDPENKAMNVNIIGKTAGQIAEQANIKIPENTQVLIAKLDGVGDDYPLSGEILAPVLAFYVVDNYHAALNLCIDLNYHGGIGHTASIHSRNKILVKEFAKIMNAGRILVNMPASQGAVGGICTAFNPSLTLGCGTGGKNITTDNVTAKHLINIQRIAFTKINKRFNSIDANLFLDANFSANDLIFEFK